MRDFRELQIWERSHQLTLDIYEATKHFPSDERFSLTNQIRRSSSSIPTTIAEGCGRDGDADFSRFLQIAMGSASESEYQLILAKDLGYLEESKYQSLSSELIEIKRMLNAFLKKLRANH